jgi:hypothetical protein
MGEAAREGLHHHRFATGEENTDLGDADLQIAGGTLTKPPLLISLKIGDSQSTLRGSGTGRGRHAW